MRRKSGSQKNGAVLVSVLKSKRDFRILHEEHWYRIPVAFLPKRAFTHIAFYQPAVFGSQGKRISYLARILKRETLPRRALLPKEISHPRAHDAYVKFSFRTILKLETPVRNIIPRRVSFGFTTLNRLQSARDILELYGVPGTEQILQAHLASRGIPVTAQETVTSRGRRCRLDFAIRCIEGAIAIECDNDKAHSSKMQQKRDRRKNAFLRHLGWQVLRFKEKDIIERPDWCTEKVQHTTRSLGGIIA